MLVIHWDGVCCFCFPCLFMCLCVLVVEYCVLLSGACVSATLLCLTVWYGLNLFVRFVCDVFV